MREASRLIWLAVSAQLLALGLFSTAAAAQPQSAADAPAHLDRVCTTLADLLSRPVDATSETLGSALVARVTAAGAAKLVEDRLIDDLLDWIAASTSYDVSKARWNKPSVSFCKFGDHLDLEHKDFVVETEFRGLYDKARRHIYLVAPWSSDDPVNVGTLLHELIHDVQLLNRAWPCWGRAEWQAYKLQEKWLKMRGVDPQFSWMRIFLITRCPRDVHP